MSTAGLRVWDANGNLITELTDNTTRVLGTVSFTTPGSGQITDSNISGHKVWVALLTLGRSSGLALYRQYSQPRFQISGNTLSWTTDFSGNLTMSTQGTFIYGVYL